MMILGGILIFFAGVFVGAFTFYLRLIKHADEYVRENSREFAEKLHEAFKERGIRVVKVRDPDES